MRRYKKQAGSSLGRRAQRGAVAMGMMAQSGRRSAFRGQTGGTDELIGGCTEPMATNYNPNANYEDGSCVFPLVDYGAGGLSGGGIPPVNGIYIGGCANSAAINFNPNANYDDGSCVFVEGCTNPAYPNYDPNAVIDDGSCMFIDEDWDGGIDEPIGGCTDSTANNYDPNADYDNGSCIYGGTLGGGMSGGGGTSGGCGFPTPYQGCTDSRAVNYNPSACFDDGSCIFSGVYADVYSNEYIANFDPCVSVCTTSSGGSTTGGGIVDSLLGTGKDPKGKGKRKRKAMRSATGRRSAFRGQTGEKAGCTCPCAANYDFFATTNDDSCVYTGGPSPVGATDGIKPTINRPTNVFRKQTGDIPTCPFLGQEIPEGVALAVPEISGCGICRCQIPDGADCPNRIGQWLGGSPYNVDESTCNCDFQSPNCVNPTGGGLLDPSLSKPTFNKLPRLKGKMKNASGRDMCGFYSNASDAPFTG